MSGKRKQAQPRAIPNLMPIKAIATMFILGLAAVMAQAALAQDKIIKSHGYSYFGDLSYPADYPHFRYVNPDAPKGGEISLATSGTFDSMNPYARKGRAGALSNIVYESLLSRAWDNTTNVPADVFGEAYGVLAHSLEYPENKAWVIFYMRPEARFADGTPVTAHDVVFSHNLFLEQGLPSYAAAVKKRVLDAEVLDDHTVKFTFSDDISRRSLVDQVGRTPVFPKHWYDETGARLDESRLEAAPGSGPYQLESYDINRRVVYKRNPDYWGKDLPFAIGRFNFDRIRVEYFGDATATFEGFKAGEFTFRSENSSKIWATGYDFPAFEAGDVVREVLPDGQPPQASGIVFNLAREPFKDVRVRKAFALAYNFEWTNESLQFGLFKQRHSFAQDTKIEAKGPPEGLELELLQSLGDLVPQEMLDEPAVRAHESKPERLNDRRNLRKAMKLLDEAGWTVSDDGLRRNANGDLLSTEFLLSSAGSPTMTGIVESYTSNLKSMGVDATFERVDPSQYTLRSREREYDLVFDGYYPLDEETGTGLRQLFGSEEAAFSVFNPAGLASPLVDALIDLSLETTSRDAELASLMAIDRALRYERFMIPVWYNDSHWVSYWDMYERPEVTPPYGVSVMDTWWINADKAAALKASGALR